MVLRHLFLTALVPLLVVVGCTYVPFDAPRTETSAAPPSGRLAVSMTRLTSQLPYGDTAIYPLPDGNDALGARLRMIEAAERSVDIKTFLIKPDIAGSLVALELVEAAERGVQVRLLVDDVFTSATDEQIARLDSHPNIEVRAFNPLSRNSTAVMNFALDFGRVNRRMHNKSMTVDGALAIVGGRNFADEYFQIDTRYDFADYDVLVAGPVAEDLGRAFDLYWNDEFALPFAALEEGDPAALAEAIALFRTKADSEAAAIYDRAVSSNYLRDIASGRLAPIPGTSRVVVDTPDKLRVNPGKGPYFVAEELYQTMNRAERDVLVVTPYFVPEDYGARFFEELAARGVRVRIFTNSLASNNHPYVHGGYAPYRKRLLDAGVELYEIRVDASKLTGGPDVPLTLHSKLAVVDGQTVFVGSTNLDPRSIRQNSEIGMIVESPALAANILDRIETVVPDFTFRVLANEDGRLEWHYEGKNRSEIFFNEPGASGFSKFVARVTSWLPVESQL